MKQAVKVHSLLLITTLLSSLPKDKRFPQLLQCFARMLAHQPLTVSQGFQCSRPGEVLQGDTDAEWVICRLGTYTNVSISPHLYLESISPLVVLISHQNKSSVGCLVDF